MKRRRKGAFTLYFGVVFMSILLVGLSLLDFARVNVYKVQAQRAMDLTTDSLITKYNKAFQEKYGFFMSERENVAGRAEFLLKENFQAGSLNSSSKRVNAVTMNAAETKEQIMEYMKYRGPLIAISKIYTMFSSIKSILSTGDKFSGRMDTELSNADFLEALDEYRLFIHGWTPHPIQHGYLYLGELKDSSDTNGYCVMSWTDFEKNNPYKPHIDMSDGNKFLNIKYFRPEHYNIEIAKIKKTEKELQLWIDSHLGKMAAAAKEHDEIIEAMYGHLKLMKEGGTEGLDEQMDALNAMTIKIDLEFPTEEKLTLEDYQSVNDMENFYTMSLYAKRFEEYIQTLPKEDISGGAITGAETDWIKMSIELNQKIDRMVLSYGNLAIFVDKYYRFFTGLIESNKHAKDKLREVAENLEEYKKYCRKEMASMDPSEGKEQDADYVAATLPILEDRLQMAELMEEQIQKIRGQENLFDQNINILNEMIDSMVMVDFWDWVTEKHRFYRADTYYGEESERNVDNIIKEIKDMAILGEKYYLKEKIMFTSFETTERCAELLFNDKRLVKEGEYDVEKHNQKQVEYAKNCESLHVDFTNEQLFGGRKETIEKTKQTAERAGNPLKKALRVVGDMFESLFSFGSGKSLEKDQIKKLPSYIYEHQGEDEKPSDEVFEAEFEGKKKLKKMGGKVKSWLRAIKDIAESFDRLTSDPLGTIYVNEYIMTAFRSSVTGQGDYKDQINLRFQKKDDNPKAKDLKLESEIEYVLGGQHSDNDNNANVAGKILALRVFPNLLYVLINGDTNAIVSSLAAAITCFFPPLYPLVYFLLAVLWAIIESVVDVLVLRQGERIAFMKVQGEFMLSPSGFAEFARVLAKIAVSKAQNELKGAISDTMDDVEQYVSDLGTEYIKKATGKIMELVDDKSEGMQKKVEEFVRGKYGSVEASIASAEKSIDNYISSVVGSYAVQVEKARAAGEDIGLIDTDNLMNTAIKKAVGYTANANMAYVKKLVDEKLKEYLPKAYGTAEDIIKKIKEDGAIRAEIDKQLQKLREELEEKLTEHVIKPLTEDMIARKNELRGEVESYLNEQIDIGAEKMQKYLDSKIANVLNSDSIKATNTTEKSNSFFKLGYEDYLRIYLIFVPEDEKMFRILDLVQLREGKEVNNYMAGVKIEMDLDIPYAFLPRLIAIAKKQSSAITANEEDFKKATFNLRSVAGY